MLPVAPDRLHKANVSGGDPYGIRLPDGTAEGLGLTDQPIVTSPRSTGPMHSAAPATGLQQDPA